MVPLSLSLPLPLSQLGPLASVSPSAPPSVVKHNGLDPPWASRSSASSWCDDPLAPTLASEPWTPHPSDPLASPWLHASSSPPWIVIPPGLPWSDVTLVLPQDFMPPAKPQPSIPLAPPGSTVVLGRSGSTVVFWVPASVPRAVSFALALHTSGVILALCLFCFPWVFTSHSFTSVGQISCFILVPPSIGSAVSLVLALVWCALWCFPSPTPPLPSHSLFPSMPQTLPPGPSRTTPTTSRTNIFSCAPGATL